jgi:hypothetical protein
VEEEDGRQSSRVEEDDGQWGSRVEEDGHYLKTIIHR